MKTRFLRLKWAARAVLLLLLLGGMGMSRMYAQTNYMEMPYYDPRYVDFDFYANYQDDLYPNYEYTLYFKITDAENHIVKLTYPGKLNEENPTSSMFYPHWTIAGDEALIDIQYRKPDGYITLPTTVTYNEITYYVEGMDEYTFYQCTGLIKVVIPGGEYTVSGASRAYYANISSHAFEGCTSLFILDVNAKTNIKSWAFNGCELLSSITIGQDVRSIETWAFNGVTHVKDLNYNAFNCTVGTRASYVSSEFSEFGSGYNAPNGCALSIGDNVMYIKESTFAGCTYMHMASDPMTIKANYIKDYAFYNCTGLSGALSITGPGTSDVTIGANAFYGAGITNLTLGPKVTSIGDMAFAGCSSISTLTYQAVNAAYNYVAHDGDIHGAFYNSGALRLGSIIINNNVTTIPNYLFYESNFVSLSIGTGVTTIGNYAFGECTGLQMVGLTFSANLSQLGEGAFMGCTGLSYILSFENSTSLTAIPMNAFKNCSIATVVLNTNITSIGEEAFRQNSYLQGVYSPSNIPPTLGLRAFPDKPVSKDGAIAYVPKCYVDAYTATSWDNYFTTFSEWYNTENTCGLNIFEDVTADGTDGLYHWSEPTNWSKGRVPETGEDLTINGHCYVDVTTPTVGMVTVNPEKELNVASGVTMTASDLINNLGAVYVYGTLTVSDNFTNNLTLAIANSGTLNAGTLVFQTYSTFTVDGGTVAVTDMSFESDVTTYINNGATVTISNDLLIYDADYDSPINVLNGSSLTIGGDIEDRSTAVGYRELIIDNSIVTVEGTFGSCVVPTIIDGQLVHNTADVQGSYEKRITASTDAAPYWYTISSPITENYDPSSLSQTMVVALETGNPAIASVYYFDQTGPDDLEWRYLAGGKDPEGPKGPEVTSIEPGRGYLYSSVDSYVDPYSGSGETMQANYSAIFNGFYLRPSNVPFSFTLEYTDENHFEHLRGWNFVGNPFPCNAYLSRSYYKMITSDGVQGFDHRVEAQIGTDVPISPCEAVFVIGDAVGNPGTVVFSRTYTRRSLGMINLAIEKRAMRGTTRVDKAIVSFREGDALPKLVLNPNSSKLYIPQNGKDYAIAVAEPMGVLPVNFEAFEDGNYTLSVTPEEAEFSYLHLIDNLTGADVDLLMQPAYTFEASTMDYPSRFKLVFSKNEASADLATDEPFAFYDGSEWILADGDATVQLVDMMGRVVLNTNGAHTISTNGMATGVYVLRLVNGNDVKTQKIVVR